MPEISDHELLVKVSACGICRTDLHVVEGDLAPRGLPIIPGHQAVGTVEKIGNAVAGFDIGSRVGIAWLHQTSAGAGSAFRVARIFASLPSLRAGVRMAGMLNT